MRNHKYKSRSHEEKIKNNLLSFIYLTLLEGVSFSFFSFQALKRCLGTSLTWMVTYMPTMASSSSAPAMLLSAKTRLRVLRKFSNWKILETEVLNCTDRITKDNCQVSFFYFSNSIKYIRKGSTSNKRAQL